MKVFVFAFITVAAAHKDEGSDEDQATKTPNLTDEEFWMQFPTGAFKTAIGCTVGIILFCVFYILVKFITACVKGALHKLKLADDILSVILSGVKLFLWVQIIPILVVQTGLPNDSVITVLSSITLSAGMALRPGIGNFVSGAMIAYLSQFEVGHIVDIGGGVRGIVKDIQMQCIKLVDPSGNVIFVPNSTTYNAEVYNHTEAGRIRIDEEFPLPVSTSTEDLQEARNAVVEALAELPNVLKEPCPVMVVLRQDSFALYIAARVWVSPEYFFSAHPMVYEAVRDALLARGLQFADANGSHALVRAGYHKTRGPAQPESTSDPAHHDIDDLSQVAILATAALQ